MQSSALFVVISVIVSVIIIVSGIVVRMIGVIVSVIGIVVRMIGVIVSVIIIVALVIKSIDYIFYEKQRVAIEKIACVWGTADTKKNNRQERQVHRY